jgi:Fe2+ transport system protein B
VDYISALFIPLVLSFLGSMLIGMVGFYTLLIAPVAGLIIAEAVRKATGKRRSKPLFLTAAVASVIGGLGSVLPLLPYMAMGYESMAMLATFLWPGVYAALVATTVFTRLSGIQITR